MYAFVDDSIQFKKEITYSWSDKEKDIVTYLGPLNSKLEYQLTQLSHQACQSIHLGIACWMNKRFACYEERFKLMEDFISAIWVSTLDPLYFKELPREKGQGAITRPMTRCCFQLTQGHEELWEDFSTGLAQYTTHSTYLFRHVCAKGYRSKFDRWLTDSIARLQETHPGCPDEFDEDEEDEDALKKYNKKLKGVPVPPQALDLSAPYNPENRIKLFQEYLDSLKPSSNIFLHTPQELKALGFQGSPYVAH